MAYEESLLPTNGNLIQRKPVRRHLLGLVKLNLNSVQWNRVRIQQDYLMAEYNWLRMELTLKKLKKQSSPVTIYPGTPRLSSSAGGCVTVTAIIMIMAEYYNRRFSACGPGPVCVLQGPPARGVTWQSRLGSARAQHETAGKGIRAAPPSRLGA
jgi:hypothetical protein